MFSYFYKKTEKSSLQQLKDDFGEFPPFPLVSQAVPFRFYTVQVRGLGDLYNQYVRWMAVLNAFIDDPALIPQQGRDSLLMFTRTCPSQSSTAPNDLPSNRRPRLVIPLPVIAIMITVSSWIKARRGQKNLGSYTPLLENDEEITVKARAKRRRGGIEPIISHEHLHYLQHRNGNSSKKEIPGIESFLVSEKINDRTLVYLLERNEVEARLHEVILSAYRGGHHLPLTPSGFVATLCACKELRESLKIIFSEAGVEAKHSGSEFSIRDFDSAFDLNRLMIYSKDETSYRFVTEVLAVMYGNLLRYYGDDRASAAFMEKVERPNLYDELYGQCPLSS